MAAKPLALQEEEGAVSLWKLGKAREQFSAYSHQKKHSPTPISQPIESVSDF